MSLDFTLYYKAGEGVDIDIEVFERNITHNLTAMALEAGLYRPLWRPDEMLGVSKARDIAPMLRTGLVLLKMNPERYRPYSASNGWGTYEDLVSFVEAVLIACEEHPNAYINACV